MTASKGTICHAIVSWRKWLFAGGGYNCPEYLDFTTALHRLAKESGIAVDEVDDLCAAETIDRNRS